MRLEFLCPHHRRSLLQDPAAAEQLWSASLEAPPASPEPTPREVRTAGAGLEAAGLYLQTTPGCGRALLDRYVTSALRLAALLTRLEQSRLAITVIALAHATIEEVVFSRKAPAAALAVCQRLDREGMALLGEPPRRESRPAAVQL
jgi:hypothetical protein